ncbi:MAG: transposase [Planctomycetes bacterium]|nr:transposase [Planctomycetota bacterium]
MLFVGYFEGIDSQRGIVWRCSDSMSLRSFLGLLPTESSPDHSSLTVIRKRMPNELIERVFAFVLKMAFDKKLVRGKTVAVDSTTLEANAAMGREVRVSAEEVAVRSVADRLLDVLCAMLRNETDY